MSSWCGSLVCRRCVRSAAHALLWIWAVTLRDATHLLLSREHADAAAQSDIEEDEAAVVEQVHQGNIAEDEVRCDSRTTSLIPLRSMS